MRIGIFDSGLGGLLIARSVIQALPEYDYTYLGDTKRVPYGNRSQEAVYQFTVEAVDFLFSQDCQLIVVACNTASAEALHRVQQEYLPKHYPGRRVLGVIIPTAEAVQELGIKNVGILATSSTVGSGAYLREIHKLAPDIVITQQAAPLLVPLIEYGGMPWIRPVIEHYLTSLKGVEAIILGCTHYVAIKELVREVMGDAQVISQDEIIADSLRNYLERHPEIEMKLSLSSDRRYLVTDLTDSTFGDEVSGLTKVELPFIAL